MNIHNKSLHLLLTMLIAISVVAISGHNYGHNQKDRTSCQLCINHDNPGKVIAVETVIVAGLTGPTVWVQGARAEQPVASMFHYPPTRGPPAFS